MTIRRGQCVHFNGIQNERCEAGVSYAEAFGELNGRACREPCIQEYESHDRIDGEMVPVWRPWPRRGYEDIPCSKLLMPTDEQIAQADAEFRVLMDRMRKVGAVVRDWRTWSRTNRVAKAEVIACPACGGRLHLSQAALNGHVWGRCETDGCVSWME